MILKTSTYKQHINTLETVEDRLQYLKNKYENKT